MPLKIEFPPTRTAPAPENWESVVKLVSLAVNREIPVCASMTPEHVTFSDPIVIALSPVLLRKMPLLRKADVAPPPFASAPLEWVS